MNDNDDESILSKLWKFERWDEKKKKMRMRSQFKFKLVPKNENEKKPRELIVKFDYQTAMKLFNSIENANIFIRCVFLRRSLSIRFQFSVETAHDLAHFVSHDIR